MANESLSGEPAWLRSKRNVRLVLAGILATTVVLRLLRDRFLDTFEDGFQNWWISGNLVLTGRYWDSYAGMTRGNWLPAYHFLAAGVIGLAGLDSIPVLKALNALLAAGTSFVIYLIAREKGPTVALLAAALFATSAIDIVVSSFALPEATMLFAMFTGYYAYTKRPMGPQRSIAVAAIAFALGAALRYEAWGFLALFGGYELLCRRTERRTAVIVLLPAIAFGAMWWAWTSQWGFFPALITAQTSTDVRYKASVGALAPATEALATFFQWYWTFNPFAIVAIAWALFRERRAFFTVVLFAFYFAEILYTVFRFGNPGPRYLHLTVPIVCIYASRAIAATARKVPSKGASLPRISRAWPAAVVAAALVLAGVLGATVANPTRNPGFLLEGMQRAGQFVSTLPLPAGKLLLAESPIAAYYSGVPPSRIVGSALLPDNATLVEQFIRENVAYVVYVTVPYYKLRVLFPDQANGHNNAFLRVLYDATGPEYDFGAPRVLVFEVVPGIS